MNELLQHEVKLRMREALTVWQSQPSQRWQAMGRTSQAPLLLAWLRCCAWTWIHTTNSQKRKHNARGPLLSRAGVLLHEIIRNSKVGSQRLGSHRLGSHRLGSHRLGSHRLGSEMIQGWEAANDWEQSRMGRWLGWHERSNVWIMSSIEYYETMKESNRHALNAIQIWWTLCSVYMLHQRNRKTKQGSACGKNPSWLMIFFVVSPRFS